MFGGDWYASVEANNVSHVFTTNTNHRMPLTNNFVEACRVGTQPYVCPHPTMANTSIIFDRTADFLECEDPPIPTEETITPTQLRREPVPNVPDEPVREVDGDYESDYDVESSSSDEEDDTPNNVDPIYDP